MTYTELYDKFLNSDKISDADKAELRALAGNDPEIKSRFAAYLNFGTAGLRGIMKVGTNAMNVYTVAHTTQGLANLIKKEKRERDGVAIACDSRNNSVEFSKKAASVLAANGIVSYIFDGPRPTPELSFALRHYGCVAGINITASHNPKEYNGYKAYWEDGAQLPPEHAAIVSSEMDKIDILSDVLEADFDAAVKEGIIKVIGAETDEAYLSAVLAQQIKTDAAAKVADELKIVYTPLHGAGHKLVPEILSRIGYKHIYTVEEQMKLDGNFPTVKKPNPEYKETFTLGIELAEKVGSDLIIATDPDADRVGAMTRTSDGSFVNITGNQMGALLLDYIITSYEETGTMPPEPLAVKTIVTTELATKICKDHGVKLYNVLTGFKYIGEVIKNHEKLGHGSFIFGFEESYGCLKGTYARDKDAVLGTMMICEMTAYYKEKNMTLYDALEALYAKYGYFKEGVSELEFPGLDGKEKMAALMNSFRAEPPKDICGKAVAYAGDYLAETIIELASGKSEPTGLPKSDVLLYKLENGDVIIVRPSGTEPKVKVYYLLSDSSRAGVEEKFSLYKDAMDKMVASKL